MPGGSAGGRSALLSLAFPSQAARQSAATIHIPPLFIVTSDRSRDPANWYRRAAELRLFPRLRPAQRSYPSLRDPASHRWLHGRLEVLVGLPLARDVRLIFPKPDR